MSNSRLEPVRRSVPVSVKTCRVARWVNLYRRAMYVGYIHTYIQVHIVKVYKYAFL